MGHEAITKLTVMPFGATSVASVLDQPAIAPRTPFERASRIIGLFKTEVINFLGPWKSVGQVEWETLKWVNWYDAERL